MNPAIAALLRGALSGALAALFVDIHVFLTWKSYDDALNYDWGTAMFHWFQGAIAGAITGGGMNATGF